MNRSLWLTFLLLIVAPAFAQQQNYPPGQTAWTIYNGASNGVALQSAINALGAGTLYIPPGIISVNTATPLTAPAGFNLLCSGTGTSFSVTGTGNLFNFSNGNVSISNCNITIATTSSRTSACLFNASTSGGSSITLSNLTFNANVTSTNNGKTFCMDVSGTAQWNIVNPIWIGPAATWQSLIEGIGTTTTVSGINVYNPVASNTLTCNDACIIVDTLTDTWKFFGGQIPPASGNAINIRNTNASTVPSWIHFNDMSTECGGPTSAFGDFVVSAGRDIRYIDGYFASCQNAVNLTGGTRIDISHNSITNIGQHCILHGATPVNVKIDDNVFEDCGVNTTNTYDYVNITSAASGCDYNGNVFRQLNANKAKYVFDFTGTISNCTFDENDASQPTMGTGYLNSMGGTNLNYLANKPAANFPNNVAGALQLGGNLTGFLAIANQGNACTNGELALSAGWQSTGSATVTAVAGLGQTCSWTITTGTTTAANPTITDTLTNALPNASTACWMIITGGTRTAAAADSFNQTTLSATAPIFTFQGTPTAAGKTYLVTRTCGP